MKRVVIITVLLNLALTAMAQQGPDESKLGAWYMYFFQKKFKDSRFGIQGDYQYRSWNGSTDMEQLLLRTGVTYRPKSNDIMFTLGYAFISTGEFGDSDETVSENRIYQEAMFPQKLGSRFFLNHRWRFEQRFIENQDFRTRFRYNLFLNVPLNKKAIEDNAIYIALYNEIFINGETEIGEGRRVQLFDRNRIYMGMGYGITNNLRAQAGYMNQTTTSWAKGQLQFSLHHNF